MKRASSGRRLRVLLGCYLIVSLVIGYRLVTIQVIDAEQFRGLAARQSQREIELPAGRGRLYDRAGEPLAMSLAAATIYANPRQLAEHPTLTPQTVAVQLADAIDRPIDELAEQLSKDAGFVYLGRQLPREVGEQVEAMRLPGVGVLSETRRVYPSNGLAAQVVGFAGVDGKGLSGLEMSMDPLLAGRPGAVRMERAPRGLEISSSPRQVQPPRPGVDVVLTLDREIQAMTERTLSDAVKGYNAQGGSAVVLDARTGEILAMASMPTFHPDRIADAKMAARRNRSVTDIFEPGSVNKVVTASAAMELGLVTPKSKFQVPGGYRVGPKTFSDSHAPMKPRMTVREIIESSSNIGTIKIAQRLGNKRLYSYLRKFGYGEKSGLNFPAESAGLLPHPAMWSATSLPTISIGQGVSATLLQVSRVFATVANGGEMVEPTLVRGRVGDDGKVLPLDAPQRRRVISPQTARQMAKMLRGVVHAAHGTCDACKVPGYDVGGKTGTAQKPSETSRGYEAGAYVGSFVGFAPVDDPELVVGVTLDEPRPVYYGGLTAGPTFQKIMKFSLSHRRIPPTRPQAPDASPAPASGSGVVTLTAADLSLGDIELTSASTAEAATAQGAAPAPTTAVAPVAAASEAPAPAAGIPAWAYQEALPAWANREATAP